MLRRGNVEPKVAAEYLSAIAEQAERMNSIIRQLLEFARRREPKVAATDLSSIARSIVKLVEPIARKAGVQVGVRAADPVLALGDAGQLEQVLSNLVVNAIHACDEGGRVDISCEAHETSTACVRVSDDGHGMDEQTMQRIFEPFFTTKDIGQGTGLGLSVAHGIVQEHRGSIAVESHVGRGSTFSVYLPRAGT
jgi:signal transduction histidine kinase